ncbi:MAG: hypothetical protein QOC86_213, partial [Gaiellales bacterium]|nr:hypothetical protein [Gaiellales bacterium]
MSSADQRAARRRRERERRRALRRSVTAAFIVGASGIVALAIVFSSGDDSRQPPAAAAGPTGPPRGGPARALRARPIDARATRLLDRRIGTLPAPLEDAGAAAIGSSIVLAGGLTAQDTSTLNVIGLHGGSAHSEGSLPAAQHDAAAATLAGAVYVFGGGDGTRQLDHILRIDRHTGRAAAVGRLPAASSDSSAATIGATAYVVGGYTGTHWLNTIVAVRPDGGSRVVAHLPVGLRYAAVAAAGTSLVVAGGSLPDGSASRAVYRFDTGRRLVTRLASLPAATTHAAAASLGGRVFIIGGRGAGLGSVSSAILAVD